MFCPRVPTSTSRNLALQAFNHWLARISLLSSPGMTCPEPHSIFKSGRKVRYQYFLLFTAIDVFVKEQMEMPDSDPRKGLIPLVISSSGIRLRMLRDSKHWRQSTAKSSSTLRASSSRAAAAPPSSRPAASSSSYTTAIVDPTVAEEEEDPPMPQQGQVDTAHNSQRTSRPMYRQDDHPQRPSGSRIVNRPPTSSLLPPANIQTRKRSRGWPDEYEPPSRRRPPPATTRSTTSTTKDLEASDAELARRYQILEQVPDRYRHLFDAEDTAQDPVQRPTRINTYFRTSRPAAATARISQASRQNTSQPRPRTSHSAQNQTSTATSSSRIHPSGSNSQIRASAVNRPQPQNRISRPQRPSSARSPPPYQRESDRQGSSSGPRRPLAPRSTPAIEVEQRLPPSGRVPRRGSQVRRVITRYIDGGESQVWMTKSDEESDEERRPWLADEILSRRYEYPSEDAGPLTQDGDLDGDANMYGADEDYEYDGEGDNMGPYGDGTLDPREYL